KNHHPFNSVLDEDYQAEVEILQPGTILPLPQTVSHDIKAIYAEMSKNVHNYFMALNSTIHLVLEGWTAPIVASFLGIVVVWFQEGVIYCAVLEFIRLPSICSTLTQKHDGKYLAEVTANCLKRFGLDKLVFNLVFL
ncbi:hypothetical protein L208DRAFT_1349570, partial [Tricholoma matsutake]